MKEYKFKENKASTILLYISAFIMIFGLITMLVVIVLSVFINNLNPIIGVGVFMMCGFLGGLFLGLSKLFSEVDTFTEDFIKEIKEELSKAKTLNELYAIQTKLLDEAVDDKYMIRLSYPLTIKSLNNEINNKIDILKKQ